VDECRITSVEGGDEECKGKAGSWPIDRKLGRGGVLDALLRGARAAAEAGRAVVTDRSWGFASATPQSVVDEVQKLTADTDPAVTYEDWIADDTFDVMGRLKDIPVPAMAICGAQDRLTPVKYHQFLAAQIPGCQLTIVQDAGHWMFWERPEVFRRTVRSFLDGLPTSPRSSP
jgi:pimeloyl-ACP methyl ester carboxylesterase